MEIKAKRPPNAYLLYSNSVREQIKKENPTLSSGEITKIIAEKYKHEDKEVLQKFIELAKEKQKEFRANNPNYTYKKASNKKKKEENEPMDPVESLNKSFKTNPFTLQCISH